MTAFCMHDGNIEYFDGKNWVTLEESKLDVLLSNLRGSGYNVEMNKDSGIILFSNGIELKILNTGEDN